MARAIPRFLPPLLVAALFPSACNESAGNDDAQTAGSGGIVSATAGTMDDTGGGPSSGGDVDPTGTLSGNADTGLPGDGTAGDDTDDTGAATTAADCELPPLPSASFATDIYAPIIADACSCHVVGTQSGLTMPDAATAQTNLVNAMAAAELPLVVPGDREASYLWAKLNGNAAAFGGAGGTMPLGAELGCDEIEAIGAWIDGGALP